MEMKPSNTMNQNTESQKEEKLAHEELMQSLPKANFMGSSKLQLLKFEDFWYPAVLIPAISTIQKHFLAKDTDLIITSFPKTGTTWLKSLLFSIVNRASHHPSQSPLLTHNPHELVYHLEAVYGGNPILPRPDQLNELPSPRVLHTHLPYTSLPESIKSSACKILYVARNPFDTFVSSYHFYSNVVKRIEEDGFQPPCIEDYLEDFIEGTIFDGPFFEHVVGYWKQSQEQSSKMLFLRYEDLKDDPIFHLKHLAEFVGFPFSPKEEKEGAIKDIIELCNINNLKEMEVNKSGFMNMYVEKKEFFRKGEVGDWTHYFTPFMVEKMNKLMEEKFGGTNLSFKLFPDS